ncbi:MAG: type II toxin-antitoxin system VapC family toxin [Chloroflexi bacterium]|nr:type II toxin-antitoxin system VapC family toxin [Chloroflexota bacterium]
MILLDTHIWFYYINDGVESLTPEVRQAIHENDTLGVSVISCWEIAMLVAKQRVRLSIDVQDWIVGALKQKGIKLIQLTPEIAVLSTRLPGNFHKDPADRMIAASCLKLGAPLLTLDERIRSWGHIQTIS